MRWSSRTAAMVLCAVTSLGWPLVSTGRLEAQVEPAPAPAPVPPPAPVPALPAPAPPPASSARRASKADPEVRVDGIIASVGAVHVGAGFTTAAGTYLRTGVVAAVDSVAMG